MPTQTPRFGLDKYDSGEDNWTHDDTVDALDELAVETDTIANRPASGDYADELFYATDQVTLYRWDATNTEWDAVGGLGTSSSRIDETLYINAVDSNSISTVKAVIENELGFPVVADPNNAPTGGGRAVIVDGSNAAYDPGLWLEVSGEFSHVPSLMGVNKQVSGSVVTTVSAVDNNVGGSGAIQEPTVRNDIYDIECSTGTTADSPAAYTTTCSSQTVESGKMYFNFRLSSLTDVYETKVSFGDQGGDAVGFKFDESSGEIRAAYWDNSAQTVAASGSEISADQNYRIMIHFQRGEKIGVYSVGASPNLLSEMDHPGGIFPSLAFAGRIRNSAASNKKLLVSSPGFVGTSG